MKVLVDHLPVIDWEAALKVTAQKRDLAEELLATLLNTLSDDIDSIKQSFQRGDFSTCQAQVHKLHGAIAYCGLPRLKMLLTALETDLKNHIMVSLPSLLDQLDTEVTLLLCLSKKTATY